MTATEEPGANTQIAVINEESIKDKIYLVRGQQVMLDFELAEIYGYETKRFAVQGICRMHLTFYPPSSV